jgi:hypothetical protein
LFFFKMPKSAIYWLLLWVQITSHPANQKTMHDTGASQRTDDGNRGALAVVTANQVRSLRQTHCSIDRHLLSNLRGHGFHEINFFAAIEKGANHQDIWYLANKTVFNHSEVRVFDERPTFGEACFSACERFIHLRGRVNYCHEFLAQKYYRSQVADMVVDFEKQRRMTHDFILFFRMDVVFITPPTFFFQVNVHLFQSEPVYDLSNDSVILTPSWAAWNGVNDRFMISQARGGLYYLNMFHGMCTRVKGTLHSMRTPLWHANDSASNARTSFSAGNLYEMPDPPNFNLSDAPGFYGAQTRSAESLLLRWLTAGGFKLPVAMSDFYFYRVRMQAVVDLIFESQLETGIESARAGIQFTCLTGTKVQILTQKRLAELKRCAQSDQDASERQQSQRGTCIYRRGVDTEPWTFDLDFDVSLVTHEGHCCSLCLHRDHCLSFTVIPRLDAGVPVPNQHICFLKRWGGAMWGPAYSTHTDTDIRQHKERVSLHRQTDIWPTWRCPHCLFGILVPPNK